MSGEPDRRGAILDAAFAEFAAKGFRGATIKSIAAAAGVQSPALLYWYFQTKEALFQAVLERHAPILGAVATAEAHLDLPPEEVLPRVARAYLASFHNPPEQRLIRLLLAEMIQRPALAAYLAERGPGRVVAFLTAYLARQIELGRLRPHDVRAGARAFIGMFVPQIATRVLAPALAAAGPTDEEQLRTAIDIFLRGLRPDTAG